jgi:hypothetical protein
VKVVPGGHSLQAIGASTGPNEHSVVNSRVNVKLGVVLAVYAGSSAV